MLEIAEKEYGEFNMQPVRQEKRRIWNGRRYKWAIVTVYDAGKPAPVQPSSLPVVMENRYKPRAQPTSIQRLVQFLADHSPASAATILDAVDLSGNYLISVLNSQDGFAQDEQGCWYLIDEVERDDDRELRPQLVYDYLFQHGPATVRDIMLTLALTKYKIHKTLNEGVDFHVVGKRSGQGGPANLWSVRS